MASSLPWSSLSKDAQQIFNDLIAYRKERGLPPIPYSPCLAFVAQTHVEDLRRGGRAAIPAGCNMHSWSGAPGTGARVDYYDDHRNAKGMWGKPAELTAYRGEGFEIAHWCSGGRGTGAVPGWHGSSGHRAVMVNEGIWAASQWRALGVGEAGGYAVAWFGKQADPQST